MASGIIKQKSSKWELLWSQPATSTHYYTKEWIPMDLSEYANLRIKFAAYPYAEDFESVTNFCRLTVYARVISWDAYTIILMPNNQIVQSTTGYQYFFQKSILAKPSGIRMGTTYSCRSDNGQKVNVAESRVIPEKIWGQKW